MMCRYLRGGGDVRDYVRVVSLIVRRHPSSFIEFDSPLPAFSLPPCLAIPIILSLPLISPLSLLLLPLSPSPVTILATSSFKLGSVHSLPTIRISLPTPDLLLPPPPDIASSGRGCKGITENSGVFDNVVDWT